MLFYKNYIAYQIVYMFVLSELEVAITSPSFVALYFMVFEIATNVNTLPEAVYCCFTRTTLFTEFCTCFYDRSYRLPSCHQVSLVYTFQFLR